MKILTKVLAVVLCLLTLTACGGPKPIFKATGPLDEELVTEGGSKLTFIDGGGRDWKTGEVLVELAAEDEYLLEGHDNNKVYRYKFGFQNGNAAYAVEDDFQLRDGDGLFAKCRSAYALGTLLLKPYAREGVELVFNRIPEEYEVNTGDGGTYKFYLKDSGYFGVEKVEEAEEDD